MGIKLVFCLAFAMVVHGGSFGPKMGPYELEIEKIELCEKQGSKKVVYGSRITKAGRGKYIYKENITLEVPLDEHFKEYIEIQKWGNGGWRPKAVEHTFKNCEEQWKVLGEFYTSLFKTAGVTVEKCPIPAGRYKVDWVIEANLEKTVPVMEYDKYRGIVQYFYKGELVGCTIVYGEVKPKVFG